MTTSMIHDYCNPICYLVVTEWVNEWVSGSGFPNPSTADQLVKEEGGVHTLTHTHTHSQPARTLSSLFYNESFQGGEPPTSSWGVAPKAVAKEMLGVALWYFESRARGQYSRDALVQKKSECRGSVKWIILPTVCFSLFV